MVSTIKVETHIRAYLDDVEALDLIMKRESLISRKDTLHWILKRLQNLEQLASIVEAKCDESAEELEKLHVEYTEEQRKKDLESNKWKGLA